MPRELALQSPLKTGKPPAVLAALEARNGQRHTALQDHRPTKAEGLKALPNTADKPEPGQLTRLAAP